MKQYARLFHTGSQIYWPGRYGYIGNDIKIVCMFMCLFKKKRISRQIYRYWIFIRNLQAGCMEFQRGEHLGGNERPN